MRWRIEEFFKFEKQSFDFENLRVRSFKSIRNLDLLLTIAIGYIAEISDKSENIKLRAEIIEFSKRLFGVPDFVYYLIADGIFEILKTVKTGIQRFFTLHESDGQFCLFGGGTGNLGET